MSYQYFDFSKISYELALEPPHIKIGYDNENSIKITTPKMTVPFGVDNIFNKVKPIISSIKSQFGFKFFNIII